MENLYTRLVQPGTLVASETLSSYQVFTERHLQVLWLEQKYFYGLTTLEGTPVEVISPGIWNHEAGPDFLKAHLRIGGVEVKGDIELHLAAEGWNQHNHNTDPRYDHVVLHLSLWRPSAQATVVTSQGQGVPQAFLHNNLTIPLQRIVQLIDLDLYPYHKFVGSGRCAQSLFSHLTPEKTVFLLRHAATHRLKQKYEHLGWHSKDPSQRLNLGSAMALGYKQNTSTFTKLYHWLLPKAERGEEALIALCLGVCGFFHASFVEKWNGSQQYRLYHGLYLMQSFAQEKMPHCPLVLHSTRPLNHPIRRFVCLAKMLTDPSMPKRAQRMCGLWELTWEKRQAAQEWERMRDLLVKHLPTYEDAYWNQHYFFEKESSSKFLPLLGSSIKQEILVNVVLPLIYKEVLERSNPKEHAAFLAFYNTFSSSYTGKSRYLTHRFFGNTPKGDLLKTVDLQQGAYQIHRDFCIHYEASCDGCPFIQRYTEHF